MLYMKYKEKNEIYEVNFKTINDNVVEVTGDYPVKTDGFFLSRTGFNDSWDYSRYTTVYKQVENGAQFSNDGSVFVEPEPVPDPEPYEPTPEELEKWEQQRKENESVPTNKELSDAMIEIAENISDIEDAIAELGSILTTV